MSINKSSLIRYKILDSCFRNTGRKFYIEHLIEECNNVLSEINPNRGSISRRQIFDDISFMESEDGWSVDLERHKEGRKVYYRYVDTSYSINNSPLNTLEIDQLKSAICILSQFKGMPQFDWVDEILQKIDVTTRNSEQTVISFDSNKYLKGIENLGALYQAIQNKQVLSIAYRSYDWAKTETIIIHPYYLKQYNNRWFLYGYNPFNSKLDWNMALDRMEIINGISNTYIGNTIDWEDYFSDIVGVTKFEASPIQEIVLHCYGRTGHYIQSKPIHESQRSKWLSTDWLEVKLLIRTNIEFENLILGHGENIEVLLPTEFREKIITRLNKANLRYIKK